MLSGNYYYAFGLLSQKKGRLGHILKRWRQMPSRYLLALLLLPPSPWLQVHMAFLTCLPCTI